MIDIYDSEIDSFRKDTICELFDGLNTTMLTIPNVTDVIMQLENEDITKTDIDKISLPIIITFLLLRQTSKSDPMVFSNDPSANDEFQQTKLTLNYGASTGVGLYKIYSWI